MVVYAGGAQKDYSPELVRDALRQTRGIEAEWITMHKFYPEYYLVVFARQEHRNRVSARPMVELAGVKLFFGHGTGKRR